MSLDMDDAVEALARRTEGRPPAPIMRPVRTPPLSSSPLLCRVRGLGFTEHDFKALCTTGISKSSVNIEAYQRSTHKQAIGEALLCYPHSHHAGILHCMALKHQEADKVR